MRGGCSLGATRPLGDTQTLLVHGTHHQVLRLLRPQHTPRRGTHPARQSHCAQGAPLLPCCPAAWLPSCPAALLPGEESSRYSLSHPCLPLDTLFSKASSLAEGCRPPIAGCSNGGSRPLIDRGTRGSEPYSPPCMRQPEPLCSAAWHRAVQCSAQYSSHEAI